MANHPKLSQEQIIKSKVSVCSECPLFDVNIRVPPIRLPTKNPMKRTKLLVIGDVPGMDETLAPFSGNSGAFVREVLKDAGLLDLGPVVLDNMVKCRPFKVDASGHVELEQPSPSVCHRCQTQLFRLIEKQQPEYILALGDTVLRQLLPKAPPLFYSHGKVLYAQNLGGSKVFAVYHPSGPMRTGSQVDLDSIMLDLKSLHGLMCGKPVYPPKLPDVVLVRPFYIQEYEYREMCAKPDDVRLPKKWQSCKTLEWEHVEELLQDGGSREIMLDIEATTLDPYSPEADIIAMSFAFDEHTGYAFPVASKWIRDIGATKTAYATLARFLKLVVRNFKRIWMHNAAFDMRYISVIMNRVFGRKFTWPPSRTYCSLISHWLVEPTSPHGLDDILTSMGYTSHKKILKQHIDGVLSSIKDDLSRARASKNKDAIEMLRAESQWANAHKFDVAQWYVLGPYNATDSALAMLVAQKTAREISKRPHLARFWPLQNRTLHTAQYMEQAGIMPNYEGMIAAKEAQELRIQKSQEDVFFNPWIIKLLIEDYGFPVSPENPLTVENIETFLNLNSPKQMSRLFFGQYTAKDEYKNPIIIYDQGLGVSTKISTRNANGWATNREVLDAIIGPDFEKEKITHPWASHVQEGGSVVHRLSGPELLKVYRRMTRKVPPEKALRKMRSLAAKCVANDLIEYRNAQKFKATYVDGIAAKIKPDGFIRDEFKVHGTVTGRWASSLHTTPNDKLLKNQFMSRFDGGGILAADQRQIEARVAAGLSCDPEMLKIVNDPTRDIHTEVTARFYQKAVDDVQKHERDNIKRIHFGTIYGRTPESLALVLFANGMPWEESIDFATRFQVDYFNMFHYLLEWKTRMFEECWHAPHVAIASNLQQQMFSVHSRKLCSVIVTPFGRELLIPKNTRYGEMKRITSNYPIQSSAGDITNQAATKVEKRLKREGLQSQLILQIHDALYIDTHPDEVGVASTILKEEMLDASQYEQWLGCTLATEVLYGPTLGTLAPYEMEGQ